MPSVAVLRVFTDDEGNYGNPLAVFLDGSAIATTERQAVAADLGFSETVFVDRPATGALRIFTPATELPFAGHPLVGVAWLLFGNRVEIDALCPPAGEVACWQDDGRVWIRGAPEWAPPWSHLQLDDAVAVDLLERPPGGEDFVQAWAWQDEARGQVRARAFAPRIGIPQDEACGSASMLLCHQLGRPLRVRHGAGSVIDVRPGPRQMVELGGRVVLQERQSYRGRRTLARQ